LFNVETVTGDHGRVLIQDLPIARFLFHSTTAVWLWLLVRPYVSYEFLSAGWEKLHERACSYRVRTCPS